MDGPSQDPARLTLRERLHEIIFEADTPAGRVFDIALIVAIVASVITVVFESVPAVKEAFGFELRALEWAFTIAFTVEYIVRLIIVASPARYARSFFGIVDLVSLLPTWISFLFPGTQSLLVIRALRLARVFRVLKLSRFLSEATVLFSALRSSARKVMIFVGTVLLAVLIMGTTMYLIEGEEGGFTSIPLAMYWAVVTMTTVGYGDITPHSPLGRMVAAVTMMIGYGIIAVPTGIVTAEIVQASREPVTTRHCQYCHTEGHARDARFCQDCGRELIAPSE